MKKKSSEWDLAVEGFRKSTVALEPFQQPVSHRLIQLAEIGPGDHVLDVATGPGDPALLVAVSVGLSGHVLAIDQSAALLAYARERARSAGLSNLEFRQMDVDCLDLPERSFEAIVCRWGLMFVSDLVSALRNMRRALKPGGRIAAAVWGPMDNVPFVAVRRAVMRKFDIPPGSTNPFSLSSSSALRKMFSAAGFDQVETETMIVEYQFRTAEQYVEIQKAMHESRLTTLRERSPEQQMEFWDALANEARRYATADGTIRMPSHVGLAKARA